MQNKKAQLSLTNPHDARGVM